MRDLFGTTGQYTRLHRPTIRAEGGDLLQATVKESLTVQNSRNGTVHIQRYQGGVSL